jgi:hypothetical protein
VCESWLEKLQVKIVTNSTEYFNSKVKPVKFKEVDWVLLKEHNFLHTNKIFVETLKSRSEFQE